MGYEVSVDAAHMLVHSRWHGVVDAAGFFDYIDTVWRDPAVQSYNELMDFRIVTRIDLSNSAIAELARYSQAFDDPGHAVRSALVADEALGFGLSRMFAALRSLLPEAGREFQAFRSEDDALVWLGGSGLDTLSPCDAS